MLRIAVCQIRTETDYDITMNKAHAMLAEAALNGAQIAVLPEMFSCPYSREYFRKFASHGHEETCAALSSWAKELDMIIVGGTVPETVGARMYNTCYVYDREGRQIARHRKMHLFDVDLPGMRFKESNTFTPGEEITVFDTEYGKMGCAVCFDVRFPELFRAMANRGAEIIFLPAQFNCKTGPKHWELSNRARAVDNQVFFVGAAAAKYEGFSYECWGHSMLVDPFGDILAEAGQGEEIIYADIDPARVAEVRAQLPTSQHLRHEIYNVAE